MPKAARQVSKSVLSTTESGDSGIDKSDSGRELMQAVLAKPSNRKSAEASKDTRISGVVIGTLSSATEGEQPMVYYPGIPTGKPLPAVSTEDLSHQKTGQELALGFVDGNPASPIVLGVIQNPAVQTQPVSQEALIDENVNVKLDGEKLTLSAEKEIVLQCGDSSITLTRAGKVILKGAYVSTHSTGVNRIKGGSVQIN